MGDVLYLKDILHNTAQGLLIPTMLLLVALIVYCLYAIGNILVEVFTERRRLKAKVPELIAQIADAKEDDIEEIIKEGGLLKRQRTPLLTLASYKNLPPDALTALAKRLLASTESYYKKRIGRTDVVAKVAPMVGLMGTLIPLGPGIVALANGNTQTLSDSLLIAFDTTVAGLVTAIVAFAVSKLRKRWYEDYLISLESIMMTMLEKYTDIHQTAMVQVAPLSQRTGDEDPRESSKEANLEVKEKVLSLEEKVSQRSKQKGVSDAG